MLMRKLSVPAGILLFVILAFFVSLKIQVRERGADQNTAELLYGMRGVHLVGMSDLVIDGGNELDTTIWYPALQDDTNSNETTYPYRIKLGPPLGNVALASFTGQAGRDAPYDLSAGPYPLVILSPGFAFGGTAYAWQAEHLASYGFVVIAMEHTETLNPENDLWQSTITRPRDVQTVLAYVDSQTAAEGTYERLIDAEKVAVIGHSYGGYTALTAAGARIDTQGLTEHCEREADDPAAWLCDMLLPHMADMAELANLETVPEELWPAWSDPRIDAAVSLAGDAFLFGQAGLAEITIPVLAIGGTADTDSPYLWGTHPTYEHISSPAKIRIGFEDAEHMIFTARCESTPLLLTLLSGEFCSDPGWDRSYAHELVNHFTTAFLLAELKGDTEAAKALMPDAGKLSSITYEAEGY